ncbi:hypothetical protein [Pseudomonas cremoricolorata]|uniref:Uncharacterized protein n=1 Tax=Pseudomonas cremoricolorata TaxID=157783 RepID=A0A089WEW1_9PSED|nr:hypothetical protein [Pseudomonas cremoricolorata]AIR87830.1 hypothetical protein LK03_00650 [Pseudomonas cremoricolorata]
MKLNAAVSAKLAVLQPNHVGVPAWSLLAHPPVPPLPHYLGGAPQRLGGVPHQPDQDTPQPTEPGSPTEPDVPPPAPQA